MEKKPFNKKIIAVIIAGVLVFVTITGFAGNAVGGGEFTNNTISSVIELFDKQEEINDQYKHEITKGSLTVTLKEDNVSFVESGHLKIKPTTAGELMIDAKKLKGESKRGTKGDVACSYIVKWYTYDKTTNEKLTIKDLGVIIESTEDEYIIPIPENPNVDNENLRLKVYIDIQEVEGSGFKTIDEINIDLNQMDKPSTLQTFGKIYEDDGMGYVTIDDYIQYAENRELSQSEQKYREYEINKYTSSNSLINLEANEGLILKAKELRETSKSDKEFINKVYKYIRSFEYDHDLFDSNTDGRFYIPQMEKQLKAEKAICVDKSWIIATILRSQGIPTKIVDGYLEGEGAHSWNEVLINGQWVAIDATSGLGHYVVTKGYKVLRVE